MMLVKYGRNYFNQNYFRIIKQLIVELIKFGSNY